MNKAQKIYIPMYKKFPSMVTSPKTFHLMV